MVPGKARLGFNSFGEGTVVKYARCPGSVKPTQSRRCFDCIAVSTNFLRGADIMNFVIHGISFTTLSLLSRNPVARSLEPSGSGGGTVLVYFILAECRLILPEAQAPQPDRDVHDGALIRVAAHHRAGR